MAANLIDEIKTAEEKASRNVLEARAEAARKLNQAKAEAESALKEAKQAATKNFRERIQMAEHTAETKARGIISEREAGANAFYAQHKEHATKAASWIAEEVMVRYGRN